MNTFLVAAIVLLLLLVLILVAYNISATYQQTITMTLPLVDTYRHLDKTYKIDSVEVTVAGTIKNKKKIASTEEIKSVIQQVILDKYQGVIVHKDKVLEVQDKKLVPISKPATLENLSVMMFNSLAPLMPKLGCQLTAVQLESEDIKIARSRYKISTYRL